MEPEYPMRVVSQHTGLSPHVIRVWERRYQAVTPLRTKTNRRRYTKEDVAKLQALSRLTERGFPISQIAQLPLKELQVMMERSPAPALTAKETEAETSHRVVENCLKKIAEFDGEGLEDLLQEAAVQFSQRKLIEEILASLMTRVGELWENGTLDSAQEHLSTYVLKNFISHLATSYHHAEEAPLMVITTPTGQLHDLGASLAAATAQAEGWRVLSLGASLPVEDMARSIRASGARVLAISIVYPADDSNLLQEIEKLGRLVPEEVAIVFGGSSAGSYRKAIEKIGATLVESLAQFREFLKTLRSSPQA